jgi:hypothetical protein
MQPTITPIEQNSMVIGWTVCLASCVDFHALHTVTVLVGELPVPRMPTTHQIIHVARVKVAPPVPPKPLKRARKAGDKWTAAHEHALPVAQRYGLDVDLVVNTIPDAVATLEAERDAIAPAIENARKITGLDPAKIERIENRYLDHSTIPHFDEHAQEMAYAHPELNWNPSEDCSPLLWELLKQAIPKRAGRYSEATLVRAAELAADRCRDEVEFSEWSDVEPAFDDSSEAPF